MFKSMKTMLPRNTKLLVTAADGSDDNQYDSRVDDFDAEKMLVSMPTHRGRPIPVTKGKLLSLSALCGAGRVSFEAQVLGVVRNPMQMLELTLPTELKNEQLRQFFRVPARMIVHMFWGGMEKLKTLETADKSIPLEEAVTDNISGGGCTIISDIKLQAGDRVVVDFSSSPIKGMELLECKVVRMSTRENGKRVAHLTFTSIKETDRDKVIQYATKRQLELRNLKEG